MNQLSKLRHEANEKECFEIDTPSYKKTDAVPLLKDLREHDVDKSLDAHEQEANIGQNHDDMTPHIRATPYMTRSTNMRPRDQCHNHRRDPTSWNIEDKPAGDSVFCC